MFSLRVSCISHAKEDCVSPVQRAGYQGFLCQTTKCVYTNIVHTTKACTYTYLCCWFCLHMTFEPSSLLDFKPENIRGGSAECTERIKEVDFSPLHSLIVGFERFMLPWNLEVWKSESVQPPTFN